MFHFHDSNIFEKILLDHGIKILKIIDKNTFEVIVEFSKNGIYGKEIQIVNFKSISEVLRWLEY